MEAVAAGSRWERIDHRSALPQIARLVSGEGGLMRFTSEDREHIAIAQGVDGAYLALVAGEPDHQRVEMALWAARTTAIDARDPGRCIVIQRHLLISHETLRALYAGAPAEAAIEPGERTDMDPVIDEVLSEAIAARATDIRFNGGTATAQLLLRRDGLMVPFRELAMPAYERMIRSLYLLCTEKSRDQDFTPERSVKGSFLRTIGKRQYSFRFQSVPQHPDTFGVSLRVLPQDQQSTTMLELGYEPNQIDTIFEILNAPRGLVVTSGPTGSGKSTLLKAMLEYLHRRHQGEALVASLEDPVEYTIEGVSQTNVSKPGQGETIDDSWQRALEDLMRTNPDIVMLGEVRNATTAAKALEIAFTGHKLLTSIHLDDIQSLYHRFGDFGIPMHRLAIDGFVNGIIRQQLIPALCPHCALPLGSAADNAVEARIRQGLEAAAPAPDALRSVRIRGAGCQRCQGTGTFGRTVVAEFMVPDAKINAAIVRGDLPAAKAMWLSGEAGHRKGSRIKTMLEHALVKVFRGQVSPIHVDRYIGNLRPNVVTPVDAAEINANGFGAPA